MANCTIADVQALVLGPGVRFAPAEHERVQEAIDATAVDVADDAGYVELMEAKRANAGHTIARESELTTVDRATYDIELRDEWCLVVGHHVDVRRCARTYPFGFCNVISMLL